MIYKCEACQNYFNKPLYMSTFDPNYKDNRYVSRHCPRCTDEDLTELYQVFDYNGMIFDSKDELIEYLEDQGYCPEKIDEIIDDEVVMLEEWNEDEELFD